MLSPVTSKYGLFCWQHACVCDIKLVTIPGRPMFSIGAHSRSPDTQPLVPIPGRPMSSIGAYSRSPDTQPLVSIPGRLRQAPILTVCYHRH